MDNETKQLVTEIKKDVAEQVTPVIKDAVTREVLDELLKRLPERKDLGGENTDAQRKAVDTVEYFKALYNGDFAKAKSLSAGTSTEGAELAPEYFASEIMRLAPSYGLVRRLARKWPMSGKTVKVPTVGSVSAYRVGEKGVITSSQPTTGNVTLTAQKLVAMIPVSNELLDDANVDIINVLAMLASEALAGKEDEWGLKGLGAGEGIFQDTLVPVLTMDSGKTSFADANGDTYLDLLSKVNVNATKNAKFVMNFSVFNALRKQKGTTNDHYVFQAPGASMPATLWNIPVEFSEVMPAMSDDASATKFAAIANFDYMIFGDRKQYSIEISRDATIKDTDGQTDIRLFEQDMSAIRIIERVDIELAEQAKAFASLKTSAS